MRWREGRRSDNIEDRRGMGSGSGGGFGGGFPGGGFPTGGGGGFRKAGLGGFGLIVVVVLALLFGVDPSQLLQQALGPMDSGNVDSSSYSPSSSSSSSTADDAELRDFVSVVLADTEDTWTEQFRQMNRTYEDPKLVLFSGGVQSACGFAETATGPFYCPGDHKVYLDLDFFRELSQRFQAPGDFAEAYVIAHEVGHHVQTLLGIMDKVDSLRSRLSEADANHLSVMVELQADCFAGVWAYHADKERQILETGDVDEGLAAAAAVGDDRLQRQAQGYVVPESFTHGTSAQRTRWFKQGLQSGRISDCDTFNAQQL
ncbi:MAG TPA: neutral zinc metallopeptidase [Hypericibacter adhaerens]|uniref:Flagellar biosynthesis protein FlgM n=1 Tax=Hypericibacter adhaerens TaxID=2602016 RepID=A0A5J6MXH9_9PROT|nr:neutral zinc metallopeptidase [Hypericibacter adhaerens]QEX22442.1 flagellar biosynthesis protein FlgM [Hypericibacter adhaerens]HWA43502.1 neutral zinc metallopeptidase [Hypericibacter adhaerens]